MFFPEETETCQNIGDNLKTSMKRSTKKIDEEPMAELEWRTTPKFIRHFMMSVFKALSFG
ncbi:hypothetical protein A6E14_03210 [Vibrio genomosp. F10]|uniref:Uncharacterized protein n=1 Tax=Vibrio genomosp. F10 TaxID=723171 RepID=A0A1B9QV94_9VIBR|nr:hypothetical protein A6E14_03210 [Vibrio genomosp. F10]